MLRTNNLYRSSLIAVLPALLFASLAWGQVTHVANDTSVPVPGAGHDYIGMMNETVDPATGSVSFRIGTPVPPGRGLTLPFSFNYDSNGVFHAGDSTNGGGNWAKSDDRLSSGGWSYSIPRLDYITHSMYLTINGADVECHYVTGYVFIDPHGGRHALGLIYGDSVCSQHGYPSYYTGGDSQYHATMSSSTTNGLPVTVASLDGTVYTFPDNGFPITTSASVTVLASAIEDRNGNKITITDNGSGNFSVTDTRGRTAIASSGFGATNNTVTVDGLSGTYTTTWSTRSPGYSVNSQFVWPNGFESYCGLNSVGGTNSVTGISALLLPNGQYYHFDYNATYGLVSKITYPDDAYVRYTWGLSSSTEGTLSDSRNFPAASPAVGTCYFNYDAPAVLERAVSFDGTNEVLVQTFSYHTDWNTGDSAMYWTSKRTTVTTTVKAVVSGTLTTVGSYTTTYNYTPQAVHPQPLDPYIVTNYVPAESSVVYQDGSTTLRTVNKTWADVNIMRGQQVVDNGTVTSDQFFRYSTIPDTNRSDLGYVMIDKYECDSAQTCYTASQASPPASYTRRTHTDYATFSATPIYPALSTLRLPSSVTVTDGSGSTLAQTAYTYDQTAVTSTSSLPGHDYTNYGSSYNNRGNATAKTDYLDAGGSSPEWTYTYDDTGQVLSMTSPCGNATCSDMIGSNHTTSYAYSNANAYLASITYPTTNNGVSHTASFTYNTASGSLLSSTDQNGRTTSYGYENSLGRLASITYPDGGSVGYSYTRSTNQTICSHPITTTTALSSGLDLVVTASVDGMCHVVGTTITDSQGNDYTATTYDGLGRVRTATNPYRSTGDSSYGVTTYSYDALGRTTSVAYPGSSTATTSYSGLTMTTTDAAGKVRVLTSDDLGRLASVVEDPSGLGYSTSYTYDDLDNLVGVSQGAQTRTFEYDSLKRLTSAMNPESGAITYVYDANSNVAGKTDARGTTSYAYDALNRLLYKNYTDTSTVRACYAYDGYGGWGDTMTNAVGRLTSSWSVQYDGGVVAGNESYQWDAMGRLQAGRQCTPGTCGSSSYPVHAAYNLAGSETGYWDSSVARYSTYDNAGRVQNFTAGFSVTEPGTSWTPGTGSQNLLTGAVYSAVGLTQATLGNGLTETRAYNNRTWLQTLTVSGSTHTLGLTYAGNGNVLTANDSVNNRQSTAWTYTYDGVNRLGTAVTGGQSFTYTYDRYGNMTCTNAGSLPCTPSGMTFNAATNRITGYSYDGSGNLRSDGAHQYHYDAENRIDCVGTDVNGNCTASSVYYFYDPQGRRVGKQQGSVLEEYVYDLAGNITSVHNGSSTLLRAELYAGGAARGDEPTGRAKLRGAVLEPRGLAGDGAGEDERFGDDGGAVL